MTGHPGQEYLDAAFGPREVERRKAEARLPPRGGKPVYLASPSRARRMWRKRAKRETHTGAVAGHRTPGPSIEGLYGPSCAASEST